VTVGRAGQVESGCVGFEHRGQSAHTGEVRMTALACEDGLLTANSGHSAFPDFGHLNDRSTLGSRSSRWRSEPRSSARAATGIFLATGRTIMCGAEGWFDDHPRRVRIPPLPRCGILAHVRLAQRARTVLLAAQVQFPNLPDRRCDKGVLPECGRVRDRVQDTCGSGVGSRNLQRGPAGMAAV